MAAGCRGLAAVGMGVVAVGSNKLDIAGDQGNQAEEENKPNRRLRTKVCGVPRGEDKERLSACAMTQRA